MKSKRAIFLSCLAAAGLFASPAFGQSQHVSTPRATARTARSYPQYGSSRYGGMWHGGDWHHHHGGSHIYFYGYPYAWYPYYWGGPWGYDYYYPYNYGYYSYGQPPYGYNSGALVEQVQSRLADNGYYSGVVDGVLGPRTRAAIRTYERRHGLPVDGMLTGQLLSHMGFR